MKPGRRILLSVPHMGGEEMKYVKEAFESNWLSTVGPNIYCLERYFEEMTGLSSVALASCTAALHLALRLAGVNQGDEVITPTLSFVASAAPILYERAKPVFLDSENETWNLSPGLLEEFLRSRARIGKVPKAVIAVHLFGQPARIDAIAKLCQEFGVFLIEDAAESIGSRYRGRHPGTFGDVGVYSFNGNKMITGTTGGMLICHREQLAAKARKWSQQSRDEDPAGINNFVHSEVGYNYRMSNVVAGIVRGQLEVLEKRVQQRRAIFARYRDEFLDIPGLVAQPDCPNAVHSRWLSCFQVKEDVFGRSAGQLIKYLDSVGVEARPVWKPLHTQPVFEQFRFIGHGVAEELHQNGICLPSSSSLSRQEQAFVIESIREASRTA